MAYATPNDVRFWTGLSSSEISDDKLTELITYATSQVNRDITVEEIREPVNYIDAVRENDNDGSTTKFYVKNYKWFLADRDNDGDVDTSDLTVYQIDTSTDPATESELTISSIDSNDGSFTLSSAPSDNVELYVTYNWCKVPYNHNLVKLATCYLVAMMANSGLMVGGIARSFRIGEIQMVNNDMSTKHYLGLYQDVVSQINNQMAEMVTNTAVPF